MGSIKDPHAFLHDWDAGGYSETKLANVLFTYESQRRLGPLGITVGSCLGPQYTHTSAHQPLRTLWCRLPVMCT